MVGKFGFIGVEAVIFGKGPTFKKVEKKENQIHICINETVNEIDEPDIVVFNDFHNFDKMDREKLKKVKIIVLPYYPHLGLHVGKPDPTKPWTLIKDSAPELECLWYPYNLLTSKPVHGYPNFQTAINSANTSVEWCVYNGIKKITTYGIAKESGYSDKFTGVLPAHVLSMIKNEIESRCKVNGVDLQML
jgi:hypothetical protein